MKRFQLPPRSITSTLLSVSRSLPLCIRLGGVGWADEDRAGGNEIPGWRSKTPLMQEEPPKNAVQGKVTIRFCILVRPLWKLLRVQLWSSSDMRSWNRAGTGGAAEAVKQAGPVATEARETGLIRCDEPYISRVSHWTTKNTGCVIAWCVVLKYSAAVSWAIKRKPSVIIQPWTFPSKLSLLAVNLKNFRTRISVGASSSTLIEGDATR